jgi:hypothetical protein
VSDATTTSQNVGIFKDVMIKAMNVNQRLFSFLIRRYDVDAVGGYDSFLTCGMLQAAGGI